HEEGVEAELLLLALGVAVAVEDLDDAGGGDVAVQRQQRYGVAVHDLALAVADGHHGGVAVADEVDLGVADLQRLVDLDGGLLLLAVGALAVGELGLVGARGALVGAAAL